MISISIQCEESEIPAVAQLLGRFGECHPTEKVEPVLALPAGPGSQAQHSEKAPDLEQNQSPKTGKVPLTDAQKAKILEMHGQGFDVQTMKVTLGILDGRQIQGIIRMKGEGGLAGHRKAPENIAPVREPTEAPQSPVAEPKPAEQQTPESKLEGAKTPATPSQDNLPPAKAISRSALNGAIWDMHVAGKNADQISEELYKQGLYYSAGSVRERLKKIEGGRA